jgi:hypothetical protein
VGLVNDVGIALRLRHRRKRPKADADQKLNFPVWQASDLVFRYRATRTALHIISTTWGNPERLHCNIMQYPAIRALAYANNNVGIAPPSDVVERKYHT